MPPGLPTIEIELEGVLMVNNFALHVDGVDIVRAKLGHHGGSRACEHILHRVRLQLRAERISKPNEACKGGQRRVVSRPLSDPGNNIFVH